MGYEKFIRKMENRVVMQTGFRICVTSEYFYPDDSGGTGMVLGELCRELKRANPLSTIHVITSNNLYRGEGKLEKNEIWNEIFIHRLNTPKSNSSSGLIRLLYGTYFSICVFIALFRIKSEFDTVLVVSNPPMLPAATSLFNALIGKPYIYLVHDLYPDVAAALGIVKDSSVPVKIFRYLQSRWLSKAESVVVLGRCMKTYLNLNYNLSPSKTSVITNWSEAVQVTQKRGSTKFKTNHDFNGSVILYAGNFGRYQNFDNILDAAKILINDEINVTFVFVGDGVQRSHILKRINEERLFNCRVLPFVPRAEFADLLASADIALVTLEPGADGLGVPSKFYNILAAGRPTLAILSPQSEVALTLDENACGIRVDQNDPRSLASAISGLLADLERLEALGMNARCAFENKYTVEKVAAQYAEIFLNVCKTKPLRTDVK